MSIHGASLNIASARRDEVHFPLWSRMPVIRDLLKKNSDKFDVLCLQEVAKTGDLSHQNVARTIRDSFTGDWEIVQCPVNDDKNCRFHRVTIYNSNKLRLLENKYWVSPNSRESQFSYLILESKFLVLGTTETYTVINCHAPMDLTDKTKYWESMITIYDQALTTSNTVEIYGDLNTFEEDFHILAKMLTDNNLTNLIDQSMITFTSFNADRDANGNLFISSLDAVIVNTLGDKKVIIVPTVGSSIQASDHYLIIY